MQELTADDIRGAFVNATERDLEIMELPLDLPLVDWFHVDFLGWRDPSTRARCYVVTEVDGVPTAIILRAAQQPSRAYNGICNICRTMQPGNQVTMMAARKGGEAGAREETIGTYMCADISCHTNVRLALPLAPGEFRANVDFRIDNTARRMRDFVRRVRDGG
ncbi:FBP domain-containing protein [Microbacterium sp. ZXX196]|uniref:FBP domain-containing protein n=1 Tax=Microbacterium sp. ZXX196 TaxID=2609291 RepID=UPI0012B80674|nr:FBP domain-containing protein [Microbacterium sp. ZXX196]MTE23302.1 FBP domain-containing protein [Microbacterium sp. ZXX196]